MYKVNKAIQEKYTNEAQKIAFRVSTGNISIGLILTCVIIVCLYLLLDNGLVEDLGVHIIKTTLVALSWSFFSYWYNRRSEVTKLGRLIHTIFSFTTALMIGLLAESLFPSASKLEGALIIGVLCTLMTASVYTLFTTLCILYAWCLGISVGLLSIFITDFSSSSIIIIAMYLVLVIFIVLYSYSGNKNFLRQHMVQLEAEDSKETISLLLNDFEEGAGDWLWELDDQLGLIYMNDEISKKLGIDVKKLHGTNVLEIIKLIGGSESTSKNDYILELVKEAFDSGKSVKDFVIPLSINKLDYWINFSAKPNFNEKGLLVSWRGVARNVTDVINYENELNYIANHDKLTGLYNRNFFDTTVASLTGEDECSLLLVNLVNDSDVVSLFGYEERNNMIKLCSTMLPFQDDEHIIYGRMNATLFYIFIKNPIHNLETTTKIFQDELNKFYSINPQVGFVKFNIGACYLKSGEDKNLIYQKAHMALTSLNEESNKRIALYDTALDTKTLTRLQLVADLNLAIKENQFYLMYQPQIDASSGKMISLEALIRWAHPERGLIPPFDFIPLTEKTGTIVELGYWILEQACTDAMKWPGPWEVSVNIASRQLSENDFCEKVSDIIERSGLAWKRLKLEITESVLIDNEKSCIATLNQLRKKGAKVSLDDFGTGYSSMTYLAKLPLDELKIDQFFVRNMDEGQNLAIIEMTVALAKKFNLSITAEGVETEEQSKTLGDLKCDKFQGYLYSKPIVQNDVFTFFESFKD